MFLLLGPRVKTELLAVLDDDAIVSNGQLNGITVSCFVKIERDSIGLQDTSSLVGLVCNLLDQNVVKNFENNHVLNWERLWDYTVNVSFTHRNMTNQCWQWMFTNISNKQLY